MAHRTSCFSFFFFNDTATTEIYTLSLHDRSSDLFAVLVCDHLKTVSFQFSQPRDHFHGIRCRGGREPKSTRLNSSHGYNSYAVFFFEKKKKAEIPRDHE